MDNASENKPKKHICAGLLAHVDAGKTTLSESLLYLTGSIRKLGRVDHKDAFLDTHELERARGITIFSRQAVFSQNEMTVTLLDTPGHVDFSSEMERTLAVLDYGILVISGTEGIQGHTLTLWKLLARHKIPTFLFINKMDQRGTDRAALQKEIQRRLDDNCIDFTEEKDSDSFLEALAMCEEELLEQYLATGKIEQEEIVRLIGERKIFPCYYGSALKLTGVENFLWGLAAYTKAPAYPREFGAKIFKIARDEQGRRLTYMKVTGGVLRVKDSLTGKERENPSACWEEKINQIRIYSGAKYETITEAYPGMVCAVTGLTKTWPGQGLGEETLAKAPQLQPVLTCQLWLPDDCDIHQTLKKLRQLEEEDPQLCILWDENVNEIHLHLMGEVQLEVLKALILERFGIAVEFSAGSIVYKETLAEPVVGVGHFEPLRHYAEVHLLMEPAPVGSGLEFAANCSEDLLDGHWQRLILTHLAEREHPGVLTGAPITDMKITLIAGKAHQKHTEGGDFRQATYRAVRQGLKKGKSILLEPYYHFSLELPGEMIGRAMADIRKMNGTFGEPEAREEWMVLTGSASVACMRDYQKEVISYSRGRGRLFCTLEGYKPCKNAKEVIESRAYDSERDMENPTGSVFCSHGSGVVIKWDQVEKYMHIDQKNWGIKGQSLPKTNMPTVASISTDAIAQEKELEEIFLRTYGPVKKRLDQGPRRVEALSKERPYRPPKEEKLPEYLLVDGYNIIFAWEELKELAKVSIDGARDKLMDILSNYQGYKKCTLILVFDAYKVAGNPGLLQRYHNIYVVYTKEEETADQYIEKVAHEIGRKYHVTVATSDGTEQVIILGQGCYLLSAWELKKEILAFREEIRGKYLQKGGPKTFLFDRLPREMADSMEEVRLGKKKL